MLCAKARKYITDNNLFLGFSVNEIKDYQSLKHASQDVESRNSAHPTAGQNHINFMYDLLRKAEPFQNELLLEEQEKIAKEVAIPCIGQQQDREKPSILGQLKAAAEIKDGQEQPQPDRKRGIDPR